MELNGLIEEDLKKHYKVTYKESPALGNKLFYEEFFGLFTEHDKVKKFLWKAIFKVDEDKIIESDILI
jgi:hypothetical protein